MFAFVLNSALLLCVLVQHSPFNVSPAPTPKRNLTKILDILNGKFGTAAAAAKKNTTVVDDPRSSLTEKEQRLMDTLLNRLYKRVIDDDGPGSAKERAVDSRERGAVADGDVGEDGRAKHGTRAADDDYDPANGGSKNKPTVARQDGGGAAGNAVSSGKHEQAADPLLLRFARLADMLDRPDGVNEAVQTMLAIPSFLNVSVALDERCPFDRLVDDDQQLVTSIIRRLRRLHLHGFESSRPGGPAAD